MHTSLDSCRDCVDRLEHCHATSVEHTDGTSECLADDPCPLPHHLHRWPVACTDLLAPCRCEQTPDAVPTAA